MHARKPTTQQKTETVANEQKQSLVPDFSFLFAYIFLLLRKHNETQQTRDKVGTFSSSSKRLFEDSSMKGRFYQKGSTSNIKDGTQNNRKSTKNSNNRTNYQTRELLDDDYELRFQQAKKTCYYRRNCTIAVLIAYLLVFLNLWMSKRLLVTTMVNENVLDIPDAFSTVAFQKGTTSTAASTTTAATSATGKTDDQSQSPMTTATTTTTPNKHSEKPIGSPRRLQYSKDDDGKRTYGKEEQDHQEHYWQEPKYLSPKIDIKTTKGVVFNDDNDKQKNSTEELNTREEYSYQSNNKHTQQAFDDDGTDDDDKSPVIVSFDRNDIQKHGTDMARVYPTKSIHNVCNSGSQNIRTPRNDVDKSFVFKVPPKGIFYNKVPKAASTTLAGINVRIALRYGRRVTTNKNKSRDKQKVHPTDGMVPTIGQNRYNENDDGEDENENIKIVPCIHNENHIEGVGYYYGNRNKDQSFLWGSIRDPATRAISRIYYYYISDRQWDPSDKNIIRLLQTTKFQFGSVSDGQGGFQLRYLSMEHRRQKKRSHGKKTTTEKMDGNDTMTTWKKNDTDDNNNTTTTSSSFSVVKHTFAASDDGVATGPVTTGIPIGAHWNKDMPGQVLNVTDLFARVQQVINDYDFLVVTERMDESLVALQLLMNLTIGDILLTSSKVGGGKTKSNKSKSYSMSHAETSKEDAPCFEIQKSVISSTVQEYLRSDIWYAQNYGDYLLYAAANYSLDLTIERQIGRERFNRALERYRHAKAIVDAECTELSGKVIFPCSSTNGTNQYIASKRNCYNFDEGCGFPCVDALLRREENRWMDG